MSGPPLGSVFSVSGRPAPGLYAGAWLATFAGIGLIAVAFAAASSGNGSGAGLFAALAFASFFGAAVLAGGYQAIVRRATRDAALYRGPSPFLLFGAVFAGASAVATSIALSGVAESLTDADRVRVSVVIAGVLYVALVWLLVVREGALSWAEMGWPTVAARRGRAAVAFLYGAVLAAPIVVLTVLLGALLVAFFQVSPPALLPIPSTPGEWIVDIAVAVVLAPLGEELFFRGFAQTAWSRDLGWRAGLVRAAVFFALIHAISSTGSDFSEGLRLAVVATLARLPVALTLGWVFHRAGSIAAPLGLHATFNGLTLVVAAVATSVAS